MNHVDQKGDSLLIKLVKKQEKHLVDFMISRDVLIHIPDADGKDACDYAKENGLALDMREFLNCSKRKKDNDM